MKSKYTAYIEMVLGMALSGSAVIVGKIVVAEFPVFLFQMYALGTAVIFSMAVLLYKHQNPFRSGIKKKDILVTILQAVLGTFLYRIFLLYGLKLTSASNSGIILSTTPAVICVLSALFFRERINSRKVFGILFTVAGMVIINISSDSSYTSYSIIGNGLVFLAVLGEAMFTLLRKKTSADLSPLSNTFFVCLFSFVLFLPFALVEYMKFDISRITFPNWISILYYGIFITVISFSLWFSGVSKVSASTAAIYTGVFPITVLVLSFFLLSELISIRYLIGMVLILLSIIFSSIEIKAGTEAANTIDNQF